MIDSQDAHRAFAARRTDGAWKVVIADSVAANRRHIEGMLGEVAILGRPVSFLHASSSCQVLARLREESDIAVVLLDVALNDATSGPQLTRVIRESPGLNALRIVLLGATPGDAPDSDTIRADDISDFRSRAELVHNVLYALLSATLTSYRQAAALKRAGHGLDALVEASTRLMEHQEVRDFADGIISEIAALLGVPPEGMVCARERGVAGGRIRVVAACGHFRPYLNRALDSLGKTTVTVALARAHAERSSLFFEESSVFFFSGKSGIDLIAYVDTGPAPDATSQRLLDVLCANIAVNLDNVALFDQLHDHAYNDQLLHIPNRLDFMHTVGNAIAGERLDKTIAVVDIDHFSQLNDALGHVYGDTLLKAVSRRLIDHLPAGTVVSRMAADTFGVLGDNTAVTPGALLALFRDPFVIEGSEQSLSATIGFARLSEVDGNGSDAVKSANIALNLAKGSSRGEGVFFTRTMEFETRARLRLLRELRSAFERERLFVVYQPQFCLTTQRMIGVEALLRWRTDEGHFVPPDQFIPLAESSGLIVELGKWVLCTACRDLKSLAGEGAPELRMAVNVSVMQFRHPGFIDIVDEALADSGIDPQLLELEITESVAMLDANFMLGTLHRLKERGIAIAIDDFGTGFSSLSYLERLAVDRLKIDQSFVNQMMLANSSLRIVETVVQLGRSLNLRVIAEGVEQRVQADLLARIGCHEAQGYLFARPMTIAQLRAFMASLAATGTPAAVPR